MLHSMPDVVRGKMSIIHFVKTKWYLLLLFVLGCSLIGALKGASIESKRKVGITEQDVMIRTRIDSGEQIDAPVFVGQIALAAEQNEFYSYKLALIGAGIGIPAGILALMLYRWIYYSKAGESVIRWLKPRDEEEDLFIHF